jgi:hypothetical protein
MLSSVRAEARAHVTSVPILCFVTETSELVSNPCGSLPAGATGYGYYNNPVIRLNCSIKASISSTCP